MPRRSAAAASTDGSTSGISPSSVFWRFHVVGSVWTNRSSSTSFDVPLEDQPAGGVVLSELRHAGEKDEIEPAGGIRDDEAGVQREVDVAIALVTGPPQLPETASGLAVGAVLGDQRAESPAG